MKPKLILGVVAIVGFTSLLMYNFGNSISTYVNFEEAVDRTSAHVIGTWDNTLDYGFSRETMRFTFHMKDEDGNVRKVVYPRPKPNNFEQATQLVVIGQMRNNTFHADEMLMKCPSKYNDTDQLEFVNAKEG
ncbi:MAG TPA: cytochrome c maturation protein CcmE [Balneolaceae bacterium]|nr:cytochrome c maturation protein CcmE [Balneolaceae bacterium]